MKRNFDPEWSRFYESGYLIKITVQVDNLLEFDDFVVVRTVHVDHVHLRVLISRDEPEGVGHPLVDLRVRVAPLEHVDLERELQRVEVVQVEAAEIAEEFCFGVGEVFGVEVVVQFQIHWIFTSFN